ncbi:MAG: arsenite S-adenosylmethyltransferase, partial [Chloroflexi bacterium]|nr:arsenite S-adenosylmethyltransferase [Chloroflexota bacterium]
GCIAGALSFAEYEAGLREAGLQRIEIVTTQAVGDGMHSAIVRAVKP